MCVAGRAVEGAGRQGPAARAGRRGEPPSGGAFQTGVGLGVIRNPNTSAVLVLLLLMTDSDLGGNWSELPCWVVSSEGQSQRLEVPC